jgi:hypothetical protein
MAANERDTGKRFFRLTELGFEQRYGRPYNNEPVKATMSSDYFEFEGTY